MPNDNLHRTKQGQLRHSTHYEVFNEIPVTIRLILTVICIATYFTITQTGSNSLIELFSLHGVAEQIALSFLGLLASLTTGAFFYRMLKTFNFKPKNLKQGILICFVPFSAAPFFTGPLIGSESLGLSLSASIITALMLYAIRVSILLDGALKCPEGLRQMGIAWQKSWQEKDFPNMARLVISCLLSLGYAVSVSDAIYAAIDSSLTLLSITPAVIPILAYTATLIGCLGTLPFVLYWVSRGLDQLTFGHNYNNNTSDRYTLYGLLLSIPSVVGVLGGTTAASGQALAKLGELGLIIRMTSSLGFGLTVFTIAFSTVFRDINEARQRKNKFLNEIKQNSDSKEWDLDPTPEILSYNESMMSSQSPAQQRKQSDPHSLTSNKIDQPLD